MTRRRERIEIGTCVRGRFESPLFFCFYHIILCNIYLAYKSSNAFSSGFFDIFIASNDCPVYNIVSLGIYIIEPYMLNCILEVVDVSGRSLLQDINGPLMYYLFEA